MADERIVNAMKIVDPATTSQEAGVDASGNLAVILAANDGVDIGDVDVTSLIPGVGATNLGKAVDAVAGASDTGVPGLVIRDDALGALSEAELDYVQMRCDVNGALWTHDDALDAAIAGSEVQVDIVAALPAGSNNIGDVDILSLVPGVAAADLGKAEDAVHGSGDTGVMMLAVRDDTPVGLAADGDYIPLTTDSVGRLHVTDPNAGAGSPTGPTTDAATSAALAAGSSVDLDSAEIVEAEKLWGVDLTASVAFKAIIRMVENAVDNANHVVVFGPAGEVVQWRPANRDFFEHAGASGGLDVFQAEVTNMDTSQAADVYATFMYST